MNKQKMTEQTKLAFEFIQKLYHETAFLIKEVENQLMQEEESFEIIKPSGYAITSKNSTGLESTNVNLWPIRKLGVMFAPSQFVEKGRSNITAFVANLKMIYLRVLLDDPKINEPKLIYGCLYDFGKNGELGKRLVKAEQLVSHIEYNESKFFKNLEKFEYDDVYIKLKGILREIDLFDLNSSEEVHTKIVEPSLEMFRGV